MSKYMLINDCYLIVLLSPLKNRMPKNFTMVNFGHPASKSRLRPCPLHMSKGIYGVHRLLAYQDFEKCQSKNVFMKCSARQDLATQLLQILI